MRETTNATTDPSSKAKISDPANPPFSNTNLTIFIKLAPNMTGMERKKVNSAAAGRATPTSSAPRMVTRGAGNQGQHLKRADDQRRLPIDFVRRIDFEDAVFILVFHDDKSDAVEDEHGGDDQRGAYFLIDFVFVENNADDSRGDTGDDHFSPKLKDILLDDGFFLVLPLKGKQLFPKQNDDGENGAQLNDDVEHIFESVALSKGNKGVHENDMPCAGNGKPLRDTFDDAQQNDFEYFCKFHKDPPTPPIFRQKR